MTLPTAWTRCHDADCEHREECLRWIDRDSGWSHAKTHRVDDGPCLAQLFQFVTDLFDRAGTRSY